MVASPRNPMMEHTTGIKYADPEMKKKKMVQYK
jgi:hypothetical protein